MVLTMLVIFTFLVLLTSSLSTPSSSPPSVYEDVINTRLEWEQNCLKPATAKGHTRGQEQGQGQEQDPRFLVDRACSIFYLHNHKTGGSTMCKTAFVNGMKISGLGENCNVPRQIRYSKHISPQEYIFEKKLQFVAQEDKPFRLNETNNRFVFMTTFRNPMDRVVSHLHHEFCGRGGSEQERRMKSHHCLSTPGTLSDVIADPCFSGQNMKAITTDYYLAMLTGCVNRMSDGNHTGSNISDSGRGSDEEWFLPPVQNTCSEVHLEEAKRLLHYFSVILISDHPLDFDRYGELLDLKFSMTFKDQYRTGTHANSDHVVEELLQHNASSRLALQMVTSLDMQLYQYAKELAESRLQVEQKQGSVAALRAFHRSQVAAEAQDTTSSSRSTSLIVQRRGRLLRGETSSEGDGSSSASVSHSHASAYPTHSAPPEHSPQGHQTMNEMRERLGISAHSEEPAPSQGYVEGPLC